MPNNRCPAFVSLLLCGAGACTASGDEIALEHGGALRGEVLRDAETPRSQITIGSPWGRITIPRSRVSRVVPTSPAEIEYRRRAPTVSDTADSQFALAEWCRDNGLGDELRTHLGRVLEIDPEHAEARQLLGYQRRGGEWVTREELLASRGLVRHEGEYRTRQEVALAEQINKREELERVWSDRLAAWRKDLDSHDRKRALSAEEQFTALEEPNASGSLVELLLEETDPGIRLLLIDAAGRVNTAPTIRALTSIALDSPDPESRAAALERLRGSGRTGVSTPFVAALRSRHNGRVNLAAEALAALGDQHALTPLIDALVTTHRQKIGSDSQGDTYSFNAAAGQFAFGGGGSRTVSTEVRNPSVHRALVAMTGVNFLYDKQRWRAWLASRDEGEPIDLRRDS